MFQSKEFEFFSKKILDRNNLKSYELVPFLGTEKVGDRVEVNLRLAEAFLQIGDNGRAESLATRAFELSGFSENVLPVYVKVFEKTKNADALKFGYKRTGIKLFREGKIAGALACFNKWQYAYDSQWKIDKYRYDQEILDTIEFFAMHYRVNYRKHLFNSVPGKIRIGYLLVHFMDPGSVLIKLDKLFAKYHDKSRFEVHYFVMESKSVVQSSQYACQLDSTLRKLGCKLTYMDHLSNLDLTYLNFAKTISDSNIDILITNAALSGFENYFVACFRPAPILVSVVHGPVAQYVTRFFDYAINSFDMHQVDTPCDSEQINIELDLKLNTTEVIDDDIDYDIPEDGIVLSCGGRLAKFHDKRYWDSLFKLLAKYSNTYLFIVGFSEEMFPFRDILTDRIMSKIRFFKWTSNYQSILRRTNIFIDSYPMGGGVLMMEIMNQAIPVISFEHDYLQFFDGSAGSASSEIASIPEIYVERENFEEFETKISFLIEHSDARKEIGMMCKEKIKATRSDPERMVKKYEAVYMRLINEKLNSKKSSQLAADTGDYEFDLFKNMKFSSLLRNFLRSVYLRVVRKFKPENK